MRHLVSAAAILALVACASCAKSVDATGVVVVVTAGPTITADTTSLVFRVYGAASDSATGGDVVTVQRAIPLDSENGFPFTFGVRPQGSDATRVYRVEVDAVDVDGHVIATARVISGYVAGRVLRVDLVLEDACRGLTCSSATTTCRASLCVDARVDPITLTPYTPETDAGADADVPSDASMDASMDASVDGAIDCGAAPTIVAGSVTTPSGTLVGAVATYACDPGYVLSGGATVVCGAGGWTGTVPSCVDDPCMPSPCLNGGTCSDVAAAASCACAAGFMGPTCAQVVGSCLDSPCAHGTCTDGAGTYACACDAGWTGANCDADLNECVDDTDGCAADARCANTQGSFACTACGANEVVAGAPGNAETCTCPSGFEVQGPACVDIDECSRNTDGCSATQACANTTGSFVCNPCGANGVVTGAPGPAESCSCGAGYALVGGTCTVWTVCAPGQYEVSAPSATDDRVCSPCSAGTYSSTTNAPSCVPWTMCGAGEYVTSAPTASNDRVCSPCAAGTFSATLNAASCAAWSTCAAGTFVSNVPSAGANRVCSPCSVGTFSTTVNAASCTAWNTCVAGTYAVVPGTPTSNRVCGGCGAGTFSAGSNAAACTTWSDCNAGTYVSSIGSSTSDRVCSVCSSGFSNTTNASACTAFTTCVAGEFIQTNGTASTDRVCTTCTNGYTTSTNAASCTAWTTCAAGSFVSTPGTPTSNRGCTACTAGTFTSTTNQASCATWSNCSPGTRVSNTPSTTVDRACTTCPSGYTTTTNAATCTSWTNCAAGSYASTVGTPTNDRACMACGAGTFTSTSNQPACAPWSDCPAGTRVSNTPSATTDRSCPACIAGTYSTTLNTMTCTQCGVGTASATVGASSPSTCLPCSSGYQALTAGLAACTDVNECMGTNGCASPGGLCTNTVGAYTCSCFAPFMGDGFTCTKAAVCGDGYLDSGEACDTGAYPAPARGGEGSPCASEWSCAASAPICLSASACQDGSLNDSCTRDSDCGAANPLCVGGKCSVTRCPATLAAETCDGLDNNCDGTVDESCSLSCAREDVPIIDRLNACQPNACTTFADQLDVPCGAVYALGGTRAYAGSVSIRGWVTVQSGALLAITGTSITVSGRISGNGRGSAALSGTGGSTQGIGGSYGGLGGTAGFSGGTRGPVYDAPTVATIFMGSGGGHSGGPGGGSGGGSGGAGVSLVAPTVTISGEILCNGTNGAQVTSYGSGGGSGGGIFVSTTVALNVSGLLSANGGSGASAPGGWAGGGGGGGRIKLFRTSGTSSMTGTSSVSGGGAGSGTFAAQSGGAGSYFQNF